ncbi:MAG: hypothetical protein AVDCRST_MAG55-2333, partial [uncultured Rubrobacteraceae bacterium]
EAVERGLVGGGGSVGRRRVGALVGDAGALCGVVGL